MTKHDLHENACYHESIYIWKIMTHDSSYSHILIHTQE